MKGKIIFFSIVAIILLGVVWYFFIRMDKKKAIKVILKYDNNAVLANLNTMGEDYLVARAKAYQKAEDSFELDGKKYSTSTGRSI